MALWRSVLHDQYIQIRHEVTYLKDWLVLGVGVSDVDRGDINAEFERLQRRLEDNFRKWEKRFGRVSEAKLDVLDTVQNTYRQWRLREIGWDEQSREQPRRIEQRPRSVHRDERREERGSLIAKIGRGLEKARDTISAGKNKAWAIFDRGIDILAGVL